MVTSFNSEFQEVTISGYGLGEDWYLNWGWARISRKIFPQEFPARIFNATC